jgi:sterol desaturase/sphingolipid hydroxylase (fatty acid hydroxylase superfamily)
LLRARQVRHANRGTGKAGVLLAGGDDMHRLRLRHLLQSAVAAAADWYDWHLSVTAFRSRYAFASRAVLRLFSARGLSYHGLVRSPPLRRGRTRFHREARLLVFLQYIRDRLKATFLEPGSAFCVTSLFAALCVAIVVVMIRRRRSGKPIGPGALARALFPVRLLANASLYADLVYFVFNTMIFTLIASALLGWTMLSSVAVSKWIQGWLGSLFAASAHPAFSGPTSRAILTLALFLAYELGYWLDHFTSHRIPFFWEIHRVHHSAEVLTPLTIYRQHPVESLKFHNFLALSNGVVGGVTTFLLGSGVSGYQIGKTNLILALFIHLYVHLQHTSIWIAFPGKLGHLLMSPAHHQIHHSRNPVHFNKNLGSCVTLFDWLFGTLHVPSRQPEKLRFGVEPDEPDVHKRLFVTPVIRAFATLRRRRQDQAMIDNRSERV